MKLVIAVISILIISLSAHAEESLCDNTLNENTLIAQTMITAAAKNTDTASSSLLNALHTLKLHTAKFCVDYFMEKNPNKTFTEKKVYATNLALYVFSSYDRVLKMRFRFANENELRILNSTLDFKPSKETNSISISFPE